MLISMSSQSRFFHRSACVDLLRTHFTPATYMQRRKTTEKSESNDYVYTQFPKTLLVCLSGPVFPNTEPPEKEEWENDEESCWSITRTVWNSYNSIVGYVKASSPKQGFTSPAPTFSPSSPVPETDEKALLFAFNASAWFEKNKVMQ